MNWLKRNLFFAIGLVVAVLLLGACGYYIWNEMSRNSTKFDSLNQIYTSLGQIKPGTDKPENTQAAKDQARQVREWIASAKKNFTPIARIPEGQLSDEAFNTSLHRVIRQLTDEASTSGVTLPQGYNFSFQAQSGKALFAPGSLDKLAVQLGEVKTITEIFYGAHINALEGIQRNRVSDDDTQSQALDYIDEQPVTTESVTMTPYQVTFRGFSSEIGQVLASLASSPNCFLVKTINVQPANAPAAGTETAAPAPMTAAASGRGPQTLLTEQMLRVTMMIEVVKLK